MTAQTSAPRPGTSGRKPGATAGQGRGSSERAPGTAAGRGRRAGGRGWRGYLPPQHGAWAMLLVPYLTGLALAGPRWTHLPLLVAWLAGYLFSYYALLAVKTRRPERVRRQLLLYGALAAPTAALVVTAEPTVLVLAPAFAALLAVNVWYAARRRERALLNDLASVVQSCLMIFVVAVSADTRPAAVGTASAVVLVYFTGTVLYVKTMIRERDNPAYRRLSSGYHLLALAAVGWLSVPVAVLFALLAARAWALPGRRLSAKRVGLLEVAFSIALVAALATPQPTILELSGAVAAFVA